MQAPKAECTAPCDQCARQVVRAVSVPRAAISGGPPSLPGPPGIKEVPAVEVAKAAVAGALGKKSGTFDGADQIIGAGK